MTSAPTAENAGGSVLDRLGVAEDPLIGADPVSFLRSLSPRAPTALAPQPATAAPRTCGWCSARVAALRATAGRAVGRTTDGPVTPPKGDKRFNDPAYARTRCTSCSSSSTCWSTSWSPSCSTLPACKPEQGRQGTLRREVPARLRWRRPTRCSATRRRCGRRSTPGARASSGVRRTCSATCVHNGGWPSQVDVRLRGRREHGDHAGQGRLPQRPHRADPVRAPDAQQVLEMPLLFCPPWINKYYIMDLAPGKSLIEWAVQHGHTCFAISYRNPDASMRDLGFEDYLMQGPLDAVRVVQEITGAREGEHAVGVPRRHADRHRPGLRRGDRRRLDQLGDVPQHPHRLQRPRARSGSSPTSRPSPASRSRWPSAATSTPTRWPTPSTRCGPTTSCSATSSTTGCSARSRRRSTCSRGTTTARGCRPRCTPQYLRSCYLRNEFAKGEFVGRGTHRRPAQGRRRHLRAVGRRRPHRAVGLRLQDDPAARREATGSCSSVGPHRRHRQPAEPQGQALGQRGQPSGRPAGVEGRGRAARGHLVGGLGDVDRRRRAGPKVAAPAKLGSDDLPAAGGRARQLRARPGVTRPGGRAAPGTSGSGGSRSATASTATATRCCC